MTAPYRITITCPLCGAGVEFVNGTSNGVMSIAVVECRPCNKQFEVAARMTIHATRSSVGYRGPRNGVDLTAV